MFATDRVRPARFAAVAQAAAADSFAVPESARSRVRFEETETIFQPRARLPTTPTVTVPLSLVRKPSKT